MCCCKRRLIFFGTISWLTILTFAAPRGTTNNSQDMDYWYEQARIALRRRLQYATEDERKPHAKNVILFVGDGMGVATVTAARILRGQRLGKSGEEHELVWDSFPAVALAKVSILSKPPDTDRDFELVGSHQRATDGFDRIPTDQSLLLLYVDLIRTKDVTRAPSMTYNMNAQIGESSACATALMCGIKTNFETVGLDSRGRFENCVSSFSSKVPSLIDWAQEAGKSTGIVTNTRITHATPAALYGHSPSRYWEDDSKIPPASRKSCKDLARQLIENDPGRNINVLLGGGRRHWLPKVARDPERTKEEGRRLDGRNLIEDWIRDKKRRYLRGHYVWNKTELAAVNPDEVDYLLGLFAYSHMDFETDRDPGPKGDPSLADMTRTALSILQKNPKGFFLFVEGGRIDHAHHFNNAYRALDETLAMEDALLVALSKVNPRDTLLIVTSDHSHVLTMGGQATPRGYPILGPDNKMSDVDGQPYSLLLYGNGPGYSSPRIVPQNSSTPNESRDQMHSSAVPRQWATHGGEDVPVYSIGPLSTILFTGTFDQSYIPHAIAYSACLGEHTLRCRSVHNGTQHHHQQQQTPQVCFPHPPEVYPSISKSSSAISDDDVVVVRQKEVVAKAEAGQPKLFANFTPAIMLFSITFVVIT